MAGRSKNGKPSHDINIYHCHDRKFSKASKHILMRLKKGYYHTFDKAKRKNIKKNYYEVKLPIKFQKEKIYISLDEVTKKIKSQSNESWAPWICTYYNIENKAHNEMSFIRYEDPKRGDGFDIICPEMTPLTEKTKEEGYSIEIRQKAYLEVDFSKDDFDSSYINIQTKFKRSFGSGHSQVSILVSLDVQ